MDYRKLPYAVIRKASQFDNDRRDNVLRRSFGARTPVAVTGSRDYDGNQVGADLSALKRKHGRLRVSHGNASGADAKASQWAKANRAQERAYPAQWEKMGRAAGPVRNKFMLQDSKPRYVLAYPRGASKGTRNAIATAQKMGLDVRVSES